MDLSSIPLISPFNYAEWKWNMVAYLESHDLLDVSFRASKESYEEKNNWLNECDREYGSMCMVMTPNMRYLMESAKYPFEL